jgi:Helix-hairpin-helix domain
MVQTMVPTRSIRFIPSFCREYLTHAMRPPLPCIQQKRESPDKKTIENKCPPIDRHPSSFQKEERADNAPADNNNNNSDDETNKDQRKRYRYSQNMDIAAKLKELGKLHQKMPLDKLDLWKAYSLNKAATRIENLDFQVTLEANTLKMVSRIQGIGESILGKIQEILTTGTIARIHVWNHDPERQVGIFIYCTGQRKTWYIYAGGTRCRVLLLTGHDAVFSTSLLYYVAFILQLLGHEDHDGNMGSRSDHSEYEVFSISDVEVLLLSFSTRLIFLTACFDFRLPNSFVFISAVPSRMCASGSLRASCTWNETRKLDWNATKIY